MTALIVFGISTVACRDFFLLYWRALTCTVR